MQIKTKLALYKTLILSITLYGHELWTLRDVDQISFKVFDTILGGKLDDGIWRHRLNYEFYKVNKEMDIVKQINTAGCGCLGT